MSVQQAFAVSHSLMQKGVVHKIGKQFGTWNVVIVGEKK